MREAEILRAFRERNRGRTVFLEHEVKGVLGEIGLSVPKGQFFRVGDGVPRKPDLTFPLVVKVSSAKFSSKTDVGGVKTGISNEEDLRKAFEELSRIKEAEGVLAEEMAPPGLEVIIGGIMDAQFGAVVMFGLGGVFVELFNDVTFGLAPLTKEDALWLMTQVKGSRLLDGYRGNPPVDKQELAAMMVSVSEMMATGIVKEIDLNPVVLYPGKALILDAKMQMLP